ncbi:MAG TPA: hypothetical protein PKG80_06770 [Acidobacteriota bacterium]|nr:hypothetical protein [Acidobacteriota bacterium]
MRANVFTDKALTKHAGRFVWLAIDAEETEKNAEFAGKYQWEGVPTFLVVDPKTEKAIYKWAGTADVAQIQLRFDEASDAFRAARSGGGDALAKANALNGDAKYKEAAAAFEEALKGQMPDTARARVVEALVGALSSAGENEACATRALAEAPKMPRGPSFANTAAGGLDCALGAPKDAKWREAAVKGLEPLCLEAVKLPGLLGDDRSGIYGTLYSARDDAGDAAGAKKLAEEWFGFVQKAAAEATNAEARTAYDSALVNAARALGDVSRALPALQANERDLPADYNPPARIAAVLRDLGRYDEALAAADRALGKAYGPRKVGIYETKAGIQEKKGDKAGARKTLEEALAFAKQVGGKNQARLVERIQKRLNH